MVHLGLVAYVLPACRPNTNRKLFRSDSPRVSPRVRTLIKKSAPEEARNNSLGRNRFGRLYKLTHISSMGPPRPPSPPFYHISSVHYDLSMMKVRIFEHCVDPRAQDTTTNDPTTMGSPSDLPRISFTLSPSQEIVPSHTQSQPSSITRLVWMITECTKLFLL